jgi:hypothetical protein
MKLSTSKITVNVALCDRQAGDCSILQPPNDPNYTNTVFIFLLAMNINVGQKEQVGPPCEAQRQP